MLRNTGINQMNTSGGFRQAGALVCNNSYYYYGNYT